MFYSIDVPASSILLHALHLSQNTHQKRQNALQVKIASTPYMLGHKLRIFVMPQAGSASSCVIQTALEDPDFTV